MLTKSGSFFFLFSLITIVCFYTTRMLLGIEFDTTNTRRIHDASLVIYLSITLLILEETARWSALLIARRMILLGYDMSSECDLYLLRYVLFFFTIIQAGSFRKLYIQI